MAKAQPQHRAPQYYGAWVGGTYYEPGQLLPVGTTDYVVYDVENLTGTQYGWRTVAALIEVGTSYEDIEDEIYSLFEDLAEDYGVVYK